MIRQNELVDIINSFGGSATIDEISEYYGKTHNMIMLAEHRTNILSMLKETKSFRKIKGTSKWEFVELIEEYLTIDGNIYFKYEYNVLNEVFGCHYNGFQRGGCSVKDIGFVWFPRVGKIRKDSEWRNNYDEKNNKWIETPITLKSKEKCRKAPTHEKRYTFIHDDNGYRFTGLYEQTDVLDDLSRVYELVDDKVKIIKGSKAPRMMICNICYMKYYKGINENDKVQGGGGDYTSSNLTGGEIWNFLPQDDHIIYGFVESGYTDSKNHLGEISFAQEIGLGNIEIGFENRDLIDDVRVVFISKGPNNDRNVVVGWYDNAVVYRKRRNRPNNDGFGYNIICNENDAHLIEESKRIFDYPKVNEDGTYNFGQAQISYPYNNTIHPDNLTTNATSLLADKLNEYLDGLLKN